MAEIKTKKINMAKDRAEVLRDLFKDVEGGARDVVDPLIDDMVFIEGRLEELRKLPQLRISPKGQKATPAAKQYKELLQQYTNIIKVLTGILRKDSGEEESPLRAYLNARARHA